MKKCPFCMQDIPEEAKVCKFCNTAVVKKCPYCAEEIVASARKCRFCQSELGGAPADAPRAPRPAAGPLGAERDILTTVLLSFFTCGVYGLVVLYKMGDELNAHQGRNQISPGVDLLLTIVTCGLWGFWLMYKYPRVLLDVTTEEGGPPVDVSVPCLLLSILAGWFGWLAAIAILQSELNKHWASHRAPGA